LRDTIIFYTLSVPKGFVKKLLEDFKEVKRVEQITSVLVKHELWHILGLLKLKKSKKNHKALTPEVLVKIFEDLSGSFLKLGQFLSLRPDLIPHEYCKALSKLQDQVPPFPNEQAKKRIADEIGKENMKSIRLISKNPVAAASIGQVYKASLTNSEQVAIKVMRPGVKEILMTDTLLLYRLAHIMHHKITVIDTVKVIEEFRRYTEAELNYLGEMQYMEWFSENFKSVRNVSIPKPHPKMCTEHVLTAQFLSGPTLRSMMARLNVRKKKLIARDLTNIMLKQIFVDGLFHADLHPGNVILLKESYGLLDFGIVGRLESAQRLHLTKLLLSLLTKDADAVVRSMQGIGFFNGPFDKLIVKEDIRQVLTPYYHLPVSKIDVGKLFLECIRVANKHQMSIPTDLVLLGKSIVTLKGLTEELDPDFDMINVVQPFMKGLVKKRYSFRNIFKTGVTEFADIEEFLTNLPNLSREYFDTSERVERDLAIIGEEMKTVSYQIRAATREFILIVILMIFIAATAFLWNIPPTLHGIGLFSFISGLGSIIILLTILSSMWRRLEV